MHRAALDVCCFGWRRRLDIRELLGGIALIGFSIYSMVTGIVQVSRHQLHALSRVDSPGLFWMAVLGLIAAGCVFIARGMNSDA